MKDLNVIIPLYNEEEIIDTVLKKWSTLFESLKIDYTIHVYNDGSKDNSLEIANSFASNKKHICVHDKVNSGHGSTILQGYRENIDAEWLFQIDSDDEIGTNEFNHFWNSRQNYDFLIGLRIERNSPLIRKIITFITRLTVTLFYGIGIKDVNCPFRLMRTELFSKYINQIPAHYFAPNVIVSGIATKKKFRIFQAPVVFHSRTTGTVSIKKWQLIRAALSSFGQAVSFSSKMRFK